MVNKSASFPDLRKTLSEDASGPPTPMIFRENDTLAKFHSLLV